MLRTTRLNYRGEYEYPIPKDYGETVVSDAPGHYSWTPGGQIIIASSCLALPSLQLRRQPKHLTRNQSLEGAMHMRCDSGNNFRLIIDITRLIHGLGLSIFSVLELSQRSLSRPWGGDARLYPVLYCIKHFSI